MGNKYVIGRLVVPSIQERINLIQNEVTTLKEVGFLLLQEVEMSSSK